MRNAAHECCPSRAEKCAPDGSERTRKSSFEPRCTGPIEHPCLLLNDLGLKWCYELEVTNRHPEYCNKYITKTRAGYQACKMEGKTCKTKGFKWEGLPPCAGGKAGPLTNHNSSVRGGSRPLHRGSRLSPRMNS